ncbi:hypothetical protein ARMSODRAFT_1077332 [Armillaria solidipes]|uniref:Uncharacterized protein n=1 Tax=Armillaria solidipes TaxID=1076256 RepID=A0A2H3C3J2_9AGAR|nr:hypothetical protein ARMSODRAFT_1077332 [Armillaria solidipes]
MSMKSPLTPNSTHWEKLHASHSATPVSSDSIASPALSPSCDASLTSTFISSPSASSTLSDAQPDIAHTQAYSSDNYSEPFNNSYAGQSDGEATNGSYEYQDYPDEMYGAIPETWSGPYA